MGRTQYDSPDVDNEVMLHHSDGYARVGDFVNVEITGAEHYDLIKEKLKSGYIVLCDRYLDSTIAYQHFNGSIDLKLIHYLQKLIDKNIRPNLTILLDANPSISKKRMHLRAKKLDRFDRESLKKMNIIKKGFLAIAKMEKKRIFVLNGNTGMDLIHDKIKSKVLKSLIK